MLVMISHFSSVRADVSLFLGLSLMPARWLLELDGMSASKA